MRRHDKRDNRKGALTVEMALVAPLFIFLLFGILEIGLAIKDYLGLNQAGREAVRSASLGASIASIDARLRAAVPSIDNTLVTWQGQWRQYHPSTGTWDATWTALADVGSGADLRNNAPADAQIKISITYPHRLVTGQLFSFIADGDNRTIMTLRSNMVMRRE